MFTRGGKLRSGAWFKGNSETEKMDLPHTLAVEIKWEKEGRKIYFEKNTQLFDSVSVPDNVEKLYPYIVKGKRKKKKKKKNFFKYYFFFFHFFFS